MVESGALLLCGVIGGGKHGRRSDGRPTPASGESSARGDGWGWVPCLRQSRECGQLAAAERALSSNRRCIVHPGAGSGGESRPPHSSLGAVWSVSGWPE